MTDMTNATRSIATTVAALPGSAAHRFGANIAAQYKADGEWRELSYAAAGEAIEEIALGLADLGIEPGDRVCILADTRIEWTLSSYGISAAGAVVVPIYPTNSPHECEWVIGNSGARAVICENPGQAAKIAEVRGALPDLAQVIGIDAGTGDLTLDDVRERGRRRDRGELGSRQAAVRPEDPYTIVYTSGTTGPPKGVVLTHANAMSVCTMVEELKFVQPDEITYLYLPLAHVFALLAQLASYDQGTTIIYFGGDTKQILAELIETRPTYLPSVPRIFEKLYAAAMKLSAQAGAAADSAEVFDRVRQLFGGQIRQAVTGAAPIAPEILEFFHSAGVPVLEGWGMTETTGVGTVCRLDQFKFGTVGRPLPGVQLRIAEDGEIEMRGPNVFREYWRNPEATAETIVDGWLRTGDLGEIDDDGYLRITGRKKEIIITAGGKNLAPANLENDLKQSPFISQAVMYGDRKPYPVALITLDAEEIVPWAKEHGLPEDLDTLAEREEVHELVQRELDRANSNYARVEQIKRFTILPHDLSVESGELTPTLKVKRNVINERYGEMFESLYSSPAE